MRGRINFPGALSPLRVSAGLVGVSVISALPARTFGRVLSGLSEARIVRELVGHQLGDVTFVLASLAVSAFGTMGVGLVCSWLLIAYLVYVHAPTLLPGRFGAVYESRDLRFLLAGYALVLGTSWEWLWRTPEETPPLIGVFLILVLPLGGLIGVDIYLRRLRPEDPFHNAGDIEPRYSNRDAEMLAAVDGTLPTQRIIRDEYRELIELQQLGGEWKILRDHGSYPLYGAFMIVFPCVLVAIMGIVVHRAYPLVEVAALFGILLVGLDRYLGRSDRLPGYDRFALDKLLLDSFSGATRGQFYKLMLCLLVTVHLVSFLSGSMYTVIAATSPGGLVGLSTVDRGYHLVVLVGFAIMSSYGLVHWVQQIRRIEPLAIYRDLQDWRANEHRNTDQEWKDEFVQPTTSIARPPGLLVPLYGWIILVGAASQASTMDVRPGPLGLPSLLTFGLVVLPGLAVWATWRAFTTNHPQSVANEARDILLTAVPYLASLGAFFVLVGELTVTDDLYLFLLGTALALGLITYFSFEIAHYESRTERKRRVLGSVCRLSAVGMLLSMVIAFTRASPQTTRIDILLGVVLLLGVGWSALPLFDITLLPLRGDSEPPFEVGETTSVVITYIGRYDSGALDDSGFPVFVSTLDRNVGERVKVVITEAFDSHARAELVHPD